jgi:hypothetical protein
MITDRQKQVVTDLKFQFKRLNSDKPKNGNYLNISSIIKNNQDGKIELEEIRLRNDAFIEHAKDILTAFEVRIKPDLKALGMKLNRYNDKTIEIYDDNNGNGCLGFFRIQTVSGDYESINNEHAQRIKGYRYSISEYATNWENANNTGFGDLMKDKCVEILISRIYNKINR